MSDTRKQAIALGILCISVSLGFIFESVAAGFLIFGVLALLAGTSPRPRT